MSKSLGNYVGINEKPQDIYGKLMSLSDALMWRYFELLTRTPEAEIAALRGGHPMEAKKLLARTLTTQYHGPEASRAAELAFVRVFQERQHPEKIDEIRLSPADLNIPAGGPVQIVRLLVAAGYVGTNSEARRMIRQGAVEVDGQRISDEKRALAPGGDYLIRVGKRAFKRVVLEGSRP